MDMPTPRVPTAQLADFCILHVKSCIELSRAVLYRKLSTNQQKYAYTLKDGVVYAHNSSNDGRRSSLLRMGSGRRRCQCVMRYHTSCDTWPTFFRAL